MFKALRCWWFHTNWKVITFDSNRTHKWKCLECDREWED